MKKTPWYIFYFWAWTEAPELDIVDEGHVVRRMPVEAVENVGKWYGVEEIVDRINDLQEFATLKWVSVKQQNKTKPKT